MNIIGYNVPRPEEGDYESFVDELTSNLEELDKSISLIGYGSFFNGSYVPGSSDIDAIMVFPYDVVIPKNIMQETGEKVSDALSDNYVPFQVTPLDTTTLQDPSLNSFTQDYKEHLEENSIVLLGEDYIEDMRCGSHKSGTENRLSHNLRKMRKNTLLREYYEDNDYEMFVKSFNQVLDIVDSGVKQVLKMEEDNSYSNSSLVDKVSNIFPRGNTESLEHLRYLRENPSELDSLYEKPSEAKIVWDKTSTFLEELIHNHIS